MSAVYCEMRDVLTDQVVTTEALKLALVDVFWCQYVSRVNRIHERLIGFGRYRPHWYIAPYPLAEIAS